MLIRFEVEGQPYPKQRPRHNRHGKTYTPSKTKGFEKEIGWYARMAMAGGMPLSGNVALVLDIRRKGKRRADVDNILKAVKDGMNGIVYNDDQQVILELAGVRYEMDNPGITVLIQDGVSITTPVWHALNILGDMADNADSV